MLLQVRGEVHHDRRLHQLMLQEGEKAWNSSRSLPSKPRSARVDIAGRTSVSSVALGSPSDSAGSMHAADCSPLDLADPLALYRWGPGASGGVLFSVICAGSAYCGHTQDVLQAAGLRWTWHGLRVCAAGPGGIRFLLLYWAAPQLPVCSLCLPEALAGHCMARPHSSVCCCRGNSPSS